MSEEIFEEFKPYFSCDINGAHFILHTSREPVNTFLANGEFESEQYNRINIIGNIEFEKEKETVPLVCLEGQVYAFKNGKLQEADVSQLLDYSNFQDNAIAITKENGSIESARAVVTENMLTGENYKNTLDQIKQDLYDEKVKLNANDFVEIVTTFKCKICPFTSQDKLELLTHLQDIHVNPNNESQKELKVDSNTNEVKLVYMCGECSLCFSTIEDCREHMINDHELMVRRTEKNNKETSETSLKASGLLSGDISESAESDPENKIIKLPNADNVDNKKDVDMKDRSIKCTHRGCPYKFSTDERMQQHATCHAESQNPSCFKCNICRNLKFSKWRQCSLHLWKSHEIDIDLLSCKICNAYKSATMVKMITHMKVHNDSRDYECPDCGKCFKQSSQLRNHRVMHLDRKSIEIPRWYTSKTCKQCGKTYADSKCLKNHIQAVHSKLRPYVCTVCGHSSARKAMLQMHLRQHTGDKPFNCELCEYKTGDHNSLRRHVMRHTGVRPYKCPHCPYSAIQSNSYKNHLRSKHPLLSGVFTCDLCSFKTVKKQSYVQHVGDHERGFIKAHDANKDGKSVQVFPGNIAAAKLIYSCLGAFSKVGRTIEANLMSSSTSADGTSQTITIQIPSKHLEGSLPSKETSVKTFSQIEQEDDETMHCFLKIPREEEESIDTGGITIPAEPEENNATQINIVK